MIQENTNAVYQTTKGLTVLVQFWLSEVSTWFHKKNNFKSFSNTSHPLAEPTFIEKPRDIETSEGSRIQVFCDAAAEPQAQIVWKKKQGMILKTSCCNMI